MKITLTLLLLTFALSAANGSATADLTVFNIADQSRAGRTITLASMLPDLSSNLTIDATTQPRYAFWHQLDSRDHHQPPVQ